jgi:hypothetical protein
MLLSNLFYGMLKFDRKFNKEHERENVKVMYFVCHREMHTIQINFFPCLKNKEKGQDHNYKQSKDFKHKKKGRAMHACGVHI